MPWPLIYFLILLSLIYNDRRVIKLTKFKALIHDKDLYGWPRFNLSVLNNYLKMKKKGINGTMSPFFLYIPLTCRHSFIFDSLNHMLWQLVYLWMVRHTKLQPRAIAFMKAIPKSRSEMCVSFRWISDRYSLQFDNQVYNWTNFSNERVIFITRKCIDLVNQSTTAHCKSCPWRVFKSLTIKSIIMCFCSNFGISSDCNNPFSLLCSTSILLQLKHCNPWSTISFYILSNQSISCVSS